MRHIFDTTHYLSTNVYNMDEVGFDLSAPRKTRRVASHHHPRNVQISLAGPGHITVIACIGLADAPVPPVIIFQGATNDGQKSWTAHREIRGAHQLAVVTQYG